MATTTRDPLIAGFGNTSCHIVIDNASLANTVAGQFFSLWQATVQPGWRCSAATAAIPTSAGALGFTKGSATACNFGVTATRPPLSLALPHGNFRYTFDWAQFGLPGHRK